MTGITVLWARLTKPDEVFVLSGAPAPDAEAGKNAIAGSSSAILVLDGRDVSRFAITLPAVKGAKALAAASFAVEDQIAQSIDDCHITLSEQTGDTTLVDVVDKSLLKTLCDRIAGQGYKLIGIYSELSVLASKGTQGLYLVRMRDEEQFYKITEAGDGVHLPFATPDAMAADRVVDQETLGEWASELTNGSSFSVNLAQGSFQPRANLSDIWVVWRRASIMGIGLLMLLTGLHFGETQSLKAQIKSIDSTANEQMQDAFPGVRSLSHMRQRLASLNEETGDPFLSLSAILLESLAEIEGASLVSLRFDTTRGTLSASLELNSFEDVRSLGRGISSRGGAMTEGSSRQTGPLIVSDIRLERAR